MKISFHRPSMLSACRLASQATASAKLAKPILRNLLLRCGQDSELMATDTEIGIRVALRAVQCDSEGSVLLSPKMIEFLKSLSGDDCTLEVGKMIRIKGAGASFDFHVEDASMFPAPLDAPECEYAKVTGNSFDELVEWASFAANISDVKYGATKGVLIEIGDKVTFVGFDGRRMSVVEVPHEGPVVQFPRTVVPIPALRIVKAVRSRCRSHRIWHSSALEACLFGASRSTETSQSTSRQSRSLIGPITPFRHSSSIALSSK